MTCSDDRRGSRPCENVIGTRLEDRLEFAFEPYFRLEGARYKEPGGYSLGLPIAPLSISLANDHGLSPGGRTWR